MAVRQHFFGACAVGLGAWELAAVTRRVPTVTSVLRRHPELRGLWLVWLAALGHHFWKEA